MLRRTKTTLVNGKPILQLPDRLVETVDCPFDVSERAFYDRVNELVQNRLESLERQGGAAKNYTSMLILLLRLRQGMYRLLRVVCVVIDHELGSVQPSVVGIGRLPEGPGGGRTESEQEPGW